MKDFINKHKWGIIAAFFVGLVCVLPQIVFINSLGGNYRGIHIFATPNEEAYIAIMQEILDGHPQVASMPFFEYKNGIPLLPATLFYLYTLPVQFLDISLANAVIAGKFVFPALLFFVIYLFLYDLLKIEKDTDKKSQILFSLAGGSLVVFGFDLVDYRSMTSYLRGLSSSEGFLIWTRPINPVSGAILLFFFLYCLNKLNIQKGKKWIFLCGVALALMMASYVFSWTLAVVILGLFGLNALFKKRWKNALEYIYILILGILLSLPYWLNNIRASKMDWYDEAAARIGMYFTHTPHLNKFVLASILLFLIVSLFAFYKKILTKPFPYWWSLSVVLLFGSLIVYNQQIITGVEIWYYHYVFYTIPLSYTVIIMLLWHITLKIYPRLTYLILTLIIGASISLGLFQQVSGYNKNFSKYAQMQNYRDVFDFFNYQAEKDCVVLVKEENTGEWSTLIPAFTHCNSYYSNENQSVLANPDDFYYRYMALLRLRGVKGEDIDQYMVDKKSEVEHALQYQLQRTLGFSDQKLENRLRAMPAYYREVVGGDFVSQLSRFRLDYILSVGELSESVSKQLPSLNKVFSSQSIFVYKF